MTYAQIEALRADIYAEPKRVKKVIIDSDTYNEVDDQFAIAYALTSPESMEVLAITAAPFLCSRSTSFGDGMEKSYNEILKLLKMLGRTDVPAYRGSHDILPNDKTPIESDAAYKIIEAAESMPDDELLYIIALGAGTNIASALLIKPEIAEKIAVIWLAGNNSYFNDYEFNLGQDVNTGRVIYNSGAGIVQVPAIGMTSHLSVSLLELEYFLDGKNELCSYLVDIVRQCFPNGPNGRTRVIWDIAGPAVLALPKRMNMFIDHTPYVTHDNVFAFKPDRPPYLYVRALDRDTIFIDLYKKLSSI